MKQKGIAFGIILRLSGDQISSAFTSKPAVFRTPQSDRFCSEASISCTLRKANLAPVLEKTTGIALRPKAIGFLKL
jgi:hypothetical protein